MQTVGLIPLISSIEYPKLDIDEEFQEDGADRSTTELLRNKGRFDLLEFNSRSQPVNNMSPKLLS
jgi:hypothetical protein